MKESLDWKQIQMTRIRLLLPLIFSIIVSCSKEKKEEALMKTNPPDTSKQEINNPYFPLAVGNYWVFEWRRRLPDGSMSTVQAIDTMMIERDTLLDNIRFYILSNNYPFQNAEILIRDVEGSILRDNGGLILPFESDDKIYNDHYGFGQNENDTLYYFWQEYPTIEKHSTAFGDFDCLVQIDFHESYLHNDPVLRADTLLYAEIGPVLRSFSYLSSGTKSIGKLINYNLVD